MENEQEEMKFPTMSHDLPMDFNAYQKKAKSTAVYPIEYAIIYPTLGLCGESGEVAEKIKKWIRDSKRTDIISEDRLVLLRKELGDVLWYIANLASDLGFSLQDIAKENIEKLADRENRGVIHGEGDSR